MTKNIFQKIVLVFSALILSLSAYGQCKIGNTFFDAGEELYYDLYFKYGVIYTRAGGASLKLTEESYKSKNAYKMEMLTKTSGMASKLFPLDDTIAAYTTKDLVPLAYLKDAHEGRDYTKERLYYSYPGGSKVNINSQRDKNGTFRFDKNLNADGCTYDLMSVVYYSRTLDFPNMKKGDFRTVEFVTGDRKIFMHLAHHGIEKVSANNKKKYDCIKLVLSLTNANERAFDKKEEEAMTVYISNDENRIPVKMEFKLRIGATRGVLKSYKGLRNKD